ncbi:MAG: DNA repair protein RecN [Mariprofundales bacterium]|nr:DNA repair protein RecN [Mariprofundales bacterium]
MIVSLHIKQFALIEQLDLQCESGMSAFTGETGAGKSIVVDALGAVFGARARADWVRHGAERAELGVVVALPEQGAAQSWLREQDLDSDDPLVLRRVIGADGRSRAWINGTPSSLKQLQSLGDLLLDLHGQHDHQSLLQAGFQRQLVDSGVDSVQLVATAAAWDDLVAAESALANFDAQQQQLTMQASWMREQLELLESLEPVADGVATLSSQVATLRNASGIRKSAAQVLRLLDGDDDNHARSRIAAAVAELKSASGLHPALADAVELLMQIEPLLDEAIRALQPACEVSCDEAELDRLEGRIAQLQESMRRHRCDEEGLCRLMEQWRSSLAAEESAEWDRQQLVAQLEQRREVWQRESYALHERRCQQSERLTELLRPLLDRLGLASMQITIDVRYHPDNANRFGCDQIVFMASSNPGEPSRPLADIASGGELSRLVLALKGCGALRNPAAIAVFDEVDVGIGGETAWSVGALLAAMGESQQLFVISHLPQVAACANHQFSIGKQQIGGRTVTKLVPLDEQGREEEIARMLGGSDAVSLNQARQMLIKGRAP